MTFSSFVVFGTHVEKLKGCMLGTKACLLDGTNDVTTSAQDIESSWYPEIDSEGLEPRPDT